MIYKIKIDKTDKVMTCLVRQDYDSLLEELLGSEFVEDYSKLIKADNEIEFNESVKNDRCECGGCEC